METEAGMGPGLLRRRLYENGCFSKKISTTTAINEQNVLSLTPYFRSGIRSFLSHFSRLFSNSLSLFNCISFLHLLSSISFFSMNSMKSSWEGIVEEWNRSWPISRARETDYTVMTSAKGKTNRRNGHMSRTRRSFLLSSLFAIWRARNQASSTDALRPASFPLA